MVNIEKNEKKMIKNKKKSDNLKNEKIEKSEIA